MHSKYYINKENQREELKIDYPNDIDLLNDESLNEIENKQKKIKNEDQHEENRYNESSMNDESKEKSVSSIQEIQDKSIKISNSNLNSLPKILNDCNFCIGNLIKKLNELAIDMNRTEQETIRTLKHEMIAVINNINLSNSSKK